MAKRNKVVDGDELPEDFVSRYTQKDIDEINREEEDAERCNRREHNEWLANERCKKETGMSIDEFCKDAQDAFESSER